MIFFSLELVFSLSLVSFFISPFCLFDPWIRDPGWVKNQNPDPGSGMNIPDHISQSLETIVWVKNA
jgi:hypothetical protein